MTNMLDAALAYAVKGLAVFPCKPDKSPYVTGGFKAATTDQERIRQWWTQWPTAMIGLPTGKGNGLWVLDVDVPRKSGEVNGIETIKSLESEHGALPATRRQMTLSGGEHYFFQYPATCEIRNSVKTLGPGLDVRGEGGYVILAPSGNGVARYEFIGNAPLAPAPQWLIDMVTAARQKQISGNASADPDVPLHPYIAKALDMSMQEIAAASEGERNNILFRNVASLAGFIPNGFLDENTLRSAAYDAYSKCNPEAPASEFDGTFRSAVDRGAQTPREIPASLPHGFRLVRDGQEAGVWYNKPGKGEGNTIEIKIGAPLIFRGWIRDEKSSNWSKLVEWYDPDGVLHSMPLSAEALANTDSSLWRKPLASGGYCFAPGKKNIDLIGQYLTGCESAMRFRGVTRTGWHNGVFVFPDMNVNDNCSEKTVMYDAPVRNPYQIAGSLADWRDKVGKYAAGNSRLIFALCIAFAPPLLDLLGQESVGFNFVGPSSIGKSTALYLAASVWGKGSCGDGYVLPWRATDNGIESQAALHSDTLLCLDEMSQAPAQVVSEAAYMLGNNQGKARANRTGNSREVKNWRLVFLSTGEQTLNNKLAEYGKMARAGQTVRLLDIPADTGCGLGLFENIFDLPNPAAYADAIKQGCLNWYGSASRAYIGRLVKLRKVASEILTHLYGGFCDELCQGSVDGQVKRAASKFALCWLAGIVAAIHGQSEQILPVSTAEIGKAVKNCFHAWIENRGGTGAWEEQQVVKAALNLVQTQSSRFEPMDSTLLIMTGTIRDRAGFKRTTDNKTIFYVLPQVFQKEICCGLHPKHAAQILSDKGILLKGEGDHWKQKLPKEVKDLGRTRVYALCVFDNE